MVQKHIDELEREGIAPPPEVPMWYEMPPDDPHDRGDDRGHVAAELRRSRTGADRRRRPRSISASAAITPRATSNARTSRRANACVPKPLGSIDRAHRRNSMRASMRCSSRAGSTAKRISRERSRRSSRWQNCSPSFARACTALAFVLYCGTVPLLTHGFRFGKTFSARISGGPLAAPLTLDYSTTVAERH